MSQENPAAFRARLEALPRIDRPPAGPQYHYTSIDALADILVCRQIQICTFDNENVAWTSAAPVWEPAATASMAFADKWGAGAELFEQGRPLPVARIRVDNAVLFEWSSFMWATGTPIEELLFMQERADLIGSDPALWAVCPRAVPWFNWRAIEAWHGGRWVDLCDAPGLEYLNTLAGVVMASPAPVSAL